MLPLVLSAALLTPAWMSGDGVAKNTTHQTSFVVYPADTNHLGTLFGGKALAEMDRCAGMTARRLLYDARARDAVTVAVEKVVFHRAGGVGDLLMVSGKIVRLGGKSISVLVRVERETRTGRDLLVEGVFVFAAYDRVAGKSIEHGLKLKE